MRTLKKIHNINYKDITNLNLHLYPIKLEMQKYGKCRSMYYKVDGHSTFVMSICKNMLANISIKLACHPTDQSLWVSNDGDFANMYAPYGGCFNNFNFEICEKFSSVLKEIVKRNAK